MSNTIVIDNDISKVQLQPGDVIIDDQSGSSKRWSTLRHTSAFRILRSTNFNK